MLSANQWVSWQHTLDINDRGLPINLQLAQTCKELSDYHAGVCTQRLKALTGLQNPNSVTQLYGWLAPRCISLEDLRAESITNELGNAPILADDVVEVLQLRQQLARSSVKKFDTIQNFYVARDGWNWVQDAYRYRGAPRTGRFSSTGVQMHNLARGTLKLDDLEAVYEVLTSLRSLEDMYDHLNEHYASGDFAGMLASMLRPVITPPPGYLLSVADYNSIEVVMLAWLAGCDDILNTFRDGKDVYKQFASSYFGVGYDDVTGEQRTYMKPPIIGAGYMLGAKGMVAYAEGFGQQLDFDEAKSLVDAYRGKYTDVPAFWYDMMNAIKYCLHDGTRQQVNAITIRKQGDMLTLQLPSGRKLWYYKPEFRMLKAPWSTPENPKNIKALTYENLQGKKWTRIATHPGKITENLTQAVAADVLTDGIWRVHNELQFRKKVCQIVGHTHDEIITMTKEDKAEFTTKYLESLMGDKYDWCPTAPIKAEGWYGAFYRKG